MNSDIDKPTLLLVEDDRLVLATLAQGLRHEGYRVLEAANGTEGLRLAVEQQPELALLDMRLPGMSGLEVARRLREETQVPFLFLSAYADEDLVQQASEHGALGYLVKPLDTPQIIAPIETALARAREIRALRASESQLTVALAGARDISTAVGVIMERNRCTQDAAFERLRGSARAQRRKVTDLAVEVIQSLESLNRFASGPGEK